MLEVGEYVRISWSGELGQIAEVLKDGWLKWKVVGGIYNRKIKINEDDYRIKHSKNIIDLIKEKDILKYKLNNLSSYKIAEVRKYKDARSFKEYLGVEGFGLEQIKILEVLTKEQYSQNCYKVEEE